MHFSQFNGIIILVLGLVCIGGTFPARAPADEPRAVTVATWNIEWFYDHNQADNYSDLAKKLSAPSESEWNWRLTEVARVIGEIKPTILVMQEVENRDVIFRLKQRLEKDHGLKYRIAFIQGLDFYTEQDVAIIYRGNLVEFSRREQTSEMWESRNYYNIHKHIFARFEWGSDDQRQQLLLANVHFRASEKAEEIRVKQARLLRKWIDDSWNDDLHVIALGDFNTEEIVGRGNPGPELEVLRKSGSHRELVDLHDRLDANDRATHMIGKQFDRILVSRSLIEDDPDRRDLVFRQISNRKDLVIRGEMDTEHRDVYYQIDQSQRDISDHYPIVAEFEFR